MAEVLTVFANPKGDLNFLTEECSVINNVLSEGKEFFPYIDQSVTASSLGDGLFNIGNDLVLFHFGGHANTENLFVEDDKKIDPYGLAKILKEYCSEKLRLVVLNGCGTYEQGNMIYEALNKDVVVISTSYEVDDEYAYGFSSELYSGLFIRNETVKDGFDKAIAKIALVSQENELRNSMFRTFASENEKKLTPNFNWGYLGDVDWRFDLNSGKGYEENLPGVNRKLVNTIVKNRDLFSEEELNNAISKAKRDDDESIIEKYLENAFPNPVCHFLYRLINGSDFGKHGFTRLKGIMSVYNTSVLLLEGMVVMLLTDAITRGKMFGIKDKLGDFLYVNRSQSLGAKRALLIHQLLAKQIEEHEISGGKQAQELFANIKNVFKDENFLRACSFFDALDNRLPTGKGSDSNRLKRISCLAEEKLGVFLSGISFLVKFQLIVIQGIEVYTLRFPNAPKKYIHKYSRMRSELSRDSINRNKSINDPLGAKSILLVNKKSFEDNNFSNQMSYFNLSPFLLDRNSVTKTDIGKQASQINLWYFSHYNQVDKVAVYVDVEHISREKWSIPVIDAEAPHLPSEYENGISNRKAEELVLEEVGKEIFQVVKVLEKVL